MSRSLRAVLLIGLMFGTVIGEAQTGGAASPPETPTIFWSQVDTFVGLTPSVGFMFLASGSPGKDGDHPELVLGPSIDIALLNFFTHLKTNNPERSKYLTFRIGYRYAKNLYKGETSTKVGVLELTPRFPLPFGFQIGDRNRIDLQGRPDRFNWNYRNRVTLLHSIPIKKFAITPYAQAEAFYNCSFGEWSQFTYQFGAISRISSRVEVDTWYRRRTGLTEPVVRANLTGVKLLLFFRTLR